MEHKLKEKLDPKDFEERIYQDWEEIYQELLLLIIWNKIISYKKVMESL